MRVKAPPCTAACRSLVLVSNPFRQLNLRRAIVRRRIEAPPLAHRSPFCSSVLHWERERTQNQSVRAGQGRGGTPDRLVFFPHLRAFSSFRLALATGEVVQASRRLFVAAAPDLSSAGPSRLLC